MKTKIFIIVSLLSLLSVNGQDDNDNRGTLVLTNYPSVGDSLNATLTDTDGLQGINVTFRLFSETNTLLNTQTIEGSGNVVNYSVTVPNRVGETLKLEASYTDVGGNIYETNNLSPPEVISGTVQTPPDMIEVTIDESPMTVSSSESITATASQIAIIIDGVVLNTSDAISIENFSEINLINGAIVRSTGSSTTIGASDFPNIITINRSSVINTGTGTAIQGEGSDDIITLIYPIFTGNIDGGGGNDTLNLTGVTLSSGSDILRVETININDNNIIASNIGNGTLSVDTAITINDGASLTIESSANIRATEHPTLNSPVRGGLFFTGTNILDNSARGMLTATTTEFSTTTYIVSSSSTTASLGAVTLGTNLTIKLTNSLPNGVPSTLFTYTNLTDPDNLSSVNLVDADDNPLIGSYSLVNVNSAIRLVNKAVSNPQIINIPLSSTRVVDLLAAITTDDQNASVQTNTMYALNGGATSTSLRGVTLSNNSLTITPEIFSSADTLEVTYTVDVSSSDLSTTTTINFIDSDTTLTFDPVTISEGASSPITGDYTLSDNDNSGDSLTADTFIGDYGTLTLTSTNNTYSYLLDNDNQDVLALDPTDTLTETLTFVTDEGIIANLEITIEGVNTAPTDLIFSGIGVFVDRGDAMGATLNLAENTTGVIATVITNDVDTPVSDLEYSITGVAGATIADFSIDEDTGALSTSGLNFEAINGDIIVTINVYDGNSNYNEDVVISVTDVNDAPIAISIPATATLLIDEANEAIKETNAIVATITIIDADTDPNFTNNPVDVTLDGTNAGAFEVVGNELRLKVGTTIRADQIFVVRIGLDGTDLFADFELTISNNPATAIREAAKSLSTSVFDTVRVLEENIRSVLEENSDSGLMDLTKFRAEFRRSSTDPRARQVLINELIPQTHTIVTPVLEDIVDNLVANLSSRSLIQIDDSKFLIINGPDAQESSSSVKQGSFWYNFSYIDGSRDGDSGYNGYDYNGYAIRGGYERLYGEVFVGATLSYNDTSVDNGSDFNSVNGGIYGNYQKDNTFFTGSFILAFSDIDLVRNRATFGNVSSDTNAISFDLDFTYGIKQKYKNTKLTYLTGLRYNTSRIDSISESGTFAASTSSTSFNNLYLKFGVVASWELTSSFSSSSFISANAAYDVNLIDGDRSVESRFTSGGGSFKTDSVDEDDSSFNLGASYQYNRNKITYEFAWNYRFSSINSFNTLAVNIKHQF